MSCQETIRLNQALLIVVLGMGNEQSVPNHTAHNIGRGERPLKNRENNGVGYIKDYEIFFKKHSPYKILGVSESDSIQHILTRYRTLLKLYHPDKGGDIKKFHLIKEAFAQVNLIHEETQFSHHLAKQAFQKQSEQDVSFVNNTVAVAAAEAKATNEKPVVGPFGPRRSIHNLEGESTREPKKGVAVVGAQDNNSNLGYAGDRDQRDFLERFNRQFQESYLENTNANHGYANPNWDEYDKEEKKYEIISYEDIHFQSSNDVTAEPLDNRFIDDFSKYPSMSDKNLNYTDFKQAYTRRACLLPDSHENIWNQHFSSYHDRDLKKIKSQRDTKQSLTPEEMNRYHERVEREKRVSESQCAEWRDWVDKQTKHYQGRQCLE